MLGTVALAAIALLSCVLAVRHPMRLDLSARGINTLDPATVDVISGLSQPATITIAGIGVSIVQTFLVTAIAFAGLSLWGYTTKRDISGWGSFLIMGLIGLIVASIINIFIGSPAIHFATESAGHAG